MGSHYDPYRREYDETFLEDWLLLKGNHWSRWLVRALFILLFLFTSLWGNIDPIQPLAILRDMAIFLGITAFITWIFRKA